MSRFFTALSSSSESDDGSDNFAQGLQKSAQAPKFLVSSEEDEDVKRVIKSELHKKIDLLNGHVTKLESYSSQKNFKKLHEEFDFFVKSINKSKSTFHDSRIPWFVVKCLVSIEALVESYWKNSEEKSKLSKNDLKALVPLRQKIRKNNSEYSNLINTFKSDPESCVDNLIDVNGDDDDDDEVLTTNEMMEQLDLNEKFDDTSSDEMMNKYDDDDSSSSFDLPTLGENQTPAQLRQLFLKKDYNKATVKRERRDKEIKVNKKKEEVPEPEQSKLYHETKLFSNEDQVSLQTFLNKVKEIMKSRGKKSYYLSYKNDLTYMMNLTKKRQFGTHILCGLTLEIIMAIYENLSAYSLNSRGAADDMSSSYESVSRGRNEKKIELIMEKLKLWVEAVIYLIGLIYLCLDDSQKLLFSAEAMSSATNLFESNYKPNDEGFVALQGDLFTFVNTADEHFVSLLNACDYNIKEYTEILRYETYLTKLIDLASSYYRKYHEKYPDNKHISNRLGELYFIKIELNYFKLNNHLSQTLATQLGIESKPENAIMLESWRNTDSIDWLHHEVIGLCNQSSTKVKSSLYLVHNFAINNKLEMAEKLFFSLNIQNKLSNLDTYTQIQYNRTVLQLSICYFRNGHFQECYDIISAIWNTDELRELAGQTTTKHGFKSHFDKKRDIKDKRYPVPYYMQFNIHLIECLLLVSAMLLQIHSLNDNLYSSDNKSICSLLLDYIKNSNNHIIRVKPSSLGERVVSAAKHIKRCDWDGCYSTIVDISCWKAFPDFDKVKPILMMEIKRQCLISYLYNFSHRFSSIKLTNLIQTFELPGDIIKTMITKIILCDNLEICWDETFQVIYPFARSTHSSARKAAGYMLNKIENSIHEYDVLKANKCSLMDISGSVEFK